MGKGTDNGNSKGGALVNGLHPTHRRVRDGWGTRAVLAGEETGNGKSVWCWRGDGGGREADFSATLLTRGVSCFGRNDVFLGGM